MNKQESKGDRSAEENKTAMQEMIDEIRRVMTLSKKNYVHLEDDAVEDSYMTCMLLLAKATELLEKEASQFKPQEQLSEEEIERMAEEKYPFGVENNYFTLPKREAFIAGFKASLKVK